MGLEILDSPEGVPEFYTDSARMSGNAFTISLEFGIQTDAIEGGPIPPPTRRNVVVRMSPQHALALRDMLVRNLARYEELIGQDIPYPKADEEEIRALTTPTSAPTGGAPARAARKKKR